MTDQWTNWLIAIPSYKRSNILPLKTLETLERYGIPRSKIYIFIVPEEEQEYKNTCNGYQIVLGVLGLVNQRAFIEQYFPINSLILFMDDDIADIFTVKDSKTRLACEDLSETISNGFLKMLIERATIWSIYPVDNTMFMFKSIPITTDLRYMIGAFYGIKNTRDILLVDDAVEDRERTILRFIRDKKVVRFNRIGMKTKYFAPGGMMSADRQIKHKISSENLVQKYPDFCRLKIRKNGYVDCQIKTKISNPLV